MSNQLQALPGALIQDFKRCGNPRCKCASGALHGPYFVRVWYEQGKRRKQYVKPVDVARTRAAIRLRELEHNIDVLRQSMARRIGQRQRALLASVVAEREQEADELCTKTHRFPPLERDVVSPTQVALCRLHGGLSTGPRSEAGREAIAAANRARSANAGPKC